MPFGTSTSPPPPDFDACAHALRQGDQTFTRLQHRINFTRRAFHSALEEFERLEARDQDTIVVSPSSVSPATQTPETQLPILGSPRTDDSGDPAGGKTSPVPALEHSESVIDINAPGSGSSQHCLGHNRFSGNQRISSRQLGCIMQAGGSEWPE